MNVRRILAAGVGVLGALLLSMPLPARSRAVKTSVATGDWSAGATWSGGTVPALGDDVVIANGHTVSMDTSPPSLNSLQVGQGTSGILELGSATGTTARTLTVTGNVTVMSGGTLRHRNSANQQHTINIGGNLTNNGTFDMVASTLRYIFLFFDTGTNTVISGGGVWDVLEVTFAKTAQSVTITNTATTNFWTRSIDDDCFFNGGTYIHNTAVTSTVDPGSINIAAASGLTVQQGTVNISTLISSTSLCAGKIQVQGGALNFGTTTFAGHLGADADPTPITISGGSMTVSGSFTFNTGMSWGYTQSAGTVTVLTSNTANGNAFSITNTTDFGTFTMSGGTIVIQNARGAGTSDFDNRATVGTVTGGTIQFGNSSTLNGEVFNCRSPNLPIPNLYIDGSTAAATKPVVNFLLSPETVTVQGSVTIETGTTLDPAGLDLTVGGNWTNKGTFTQGTRTVTFNGASTQTIGGSANTTFYNLTLTGAGTRQFGNNASARTFAVTNTLTWSDGGLTVGQPGVADILNLSLANQTATVQSGRTLTTVGSAVFNLGGTTGTNGITIFTGSTLVMAAGGTSAVACGGNYTNSGTLTPNTSTVTFNGSGASTIDSGGTGASPNKRFYRMVVNKSGGTASLSTNAIYVIDALTITGGTLDLVTLTLSSVGTDLTIDGGTLAFGTSGQNPSITVSGNVLKSSGGLTMNSATDILTVAGNFSVSGGTSDLTDGDIGVSGNIDISGASSYVAAVAHVLRPRGTGDTTIAITGASNTIGELQIQKGASTAKVTTAGSVTAIDIDVIEGVLEILAHTLTMSGTSLVFEIQAGAELRMQTAGGLLDSKGDFDIQTGGSVTISDGEIRVGDDFLALGGAFDPTGGTVTFIISTATSLQDISLDGNDNFHHLVISPPSTTTSDTWQPLTTATLTVNGNFTINAAPAGGSTFTVSMVNGANLFTLDLAGDFTMVTGAFPTTFVPSTPVHTVGGSWDDSGGTFQASAGTIRFDTTSSPTLKVGAANFFQNLEVAKSAGTLTVSATSAAVDVNGNLTISSGTLAANGIGIEVAGLWNGSAGTFTASGNTVTMDGALAQTITSGTGSFHNLTIANTAADFSSNEVYLLNAATVANVLTVSDGAFSIQGQTLTLSAAGVTHAVGAGAFLLSFRVGLDGGSASSTILVGNSSTLSVSGTLRLVRGWQSNTGLSIVDAAGGGTNSYSIRLESGSVGQLQFFTIRRLGVNGLIFKKSCEISMFDEGTFENNNGVYLNFAEGTASTWPDGGDRNKMVRAMANVTFTGSSGTNVRTGPGTPAIQFLGNTGSNGPRWGPDYADDTALRLRWISGAVKRMTSDTTSDASYDTIRQAFTANAAASRRFRMTDNAISCEFMNVDDLGWSVGVSHILENARLSTGIYYAIVDSDGDTTPRVTLRNCVIETWGAYEVIAENCVIFRTGMFSWTSIPDAPNSTLKNCVREIADAGTTAVVVSGSDRNLELRTSDGAAYFINHPNFDFHLRSSATLAQDEGNALTYAFDADGNARGFDGKVGGTASNWDMGPHEFMGAAVTPKPLTSAGSPISVGSVSRALLLGTTRGTASGYTFGYLSTRSGGAVNNNTFSVIRWDASAFEVVASFTAPAPILSFTYWVDNNTATANWRAWIFLVLDGYVGGTGGTQGQDGQGDCILVLVDKGDGGLVHPDQAISDGDVTKRRFGDILYTTGRYVYRPGATAADTETVAYRIERLTPATVLSDGTDDAPSVVYNSPVNENRTRWLRLFFAAAKSTGTQPDAALIKMNADPYDNNDNGGGGNRAFGGTIWAKMRTSDPNVPNTSTSNWYNYDYRGIITFTFGSSFQEIFVPASDQPVAPSRTVMVRYSMSGAAAPTAASRDWQVAHEAAAVDENRFGGVLDGTGSSASLTYGMSDGKVVYNRNSDSASGSSGLRWATVLKDGTGTSRTPVITSQRFNPTNFVLTGYDGGINKIWAFGIDDAKNGCLASSGQKVDLGADPSNPPPPAETSVPGTVDSDWPISCLGKPIDRIWPRGAKIYWATDKGYVYGANWERTGSAPVALDEGVIPGYPYQIPGARITWIVVNPATKVIVGTDSGGVYQFEP